MRLCPLVIRAGDKAGEASREWCFLFLRTDTEAVCADFICVMRLGEGCKTVCGAPAYTGLL